MTFLQFWGATLYTMRGGLIPIFLLSILWLIYDLMEQKWKDRPSNIKKRKRTKLMFFFSLFLPNEISF